ncbi:hypothetical protein [Desulforhopalus sp. 52FAK]
MCLTTMEFIAIIYAFLAGNLNGTIGVFSKFSGLTAGSKGSSNNTSELP